MGRTKHGSITCVYFKLLILREFEAIKGIIIRSRKLKDRQKADRKGQIMIYKMVHRKLKSEKQNLTKHRMKSGAPEGISYSTINVTSLKNIINLHLMN